MWQWEASVTVRRLVEGTKESSIINREEDAAVRILIVSETFYPSIDGVATRLKEAVRYMTRQGHEVAVIAPDLGQDHFEGVPILGVPAHRMPLYRTRPWGLPGKKIHHMIQDFRADVVHVANPLLIGLSGVRAAKSLDLPLVVSHHTNLDVYLSYYHLDFGWLHKLYWQMVRRLHHAADINLCTSRAMQHLLQSHGVSRVHTLRRGVDVHHLHPRYKSEAMRARLSDNHPDDLLLLFVGRLAPEKELERLEIMLDRAPDVRLAIVGDGPSKEKLEALYRGKNVVFTGYLEGDMLSEAYASADAFVFPSVSETLGLVILEAMASGLPVIGAHSAPTKEQITVGKTGFLFDPTDSNTLLDAIAQLRDPELRGRMSACARKQAESFGWSVTSQQMVDYYHMAIAHHRRTRMG